MVRRATRSDLRDAMVRAEMTGFRLASLYLRSGDRAELGERVLRLVKLAPIKAATWARATRPGVVSRSKPWASPTTSHPGCGT